MLGFDTGGLRAIDQELKEAVCSALVNLTVSRVSGAGTTGEVVYGISPRRSIVSGQLLPRYDAVGQDDESSDIRIAAQGIDFQTDVGSDAETQVQISFAVYVRVLPDWAEITDDDLDLEVDFALQRAVQDQIDAQIRQMRDARFTEAGIARPNWQNLSSTQKQEVRARRAAIQEEVRRAAYATVGIVLEQSDDQLLRPAAADVPPLPATTNPPTEAGNGPPPAVPAVPPAADDAEPRYRLGRLIQRGREIPFGLLDSADPPMKWRRIDLTLPRLATRLNATQEELDAATAVFNLQVRDAVQAQVSAWLASAEGVRAAWRDVVVRPQDIISQAAWEAYRDRAAAMPVPVPLLLPKVDGASLQIDRMVDYADPTRASFRVLLDNRTAEVTRQESFTRSDTLFCTSLSVQLPAAAHRALRLDRVEPSYRFRQFLNYPAIGLNCGVVASEQDGTLSLLTTWAPQFVQPRIVPRSINDVPTSFETLASDTLPIGQLLRLPQDYLAWIAQEEARLRSSVRDGLSADDAAREDRRLTEDLSRQRREASFIEQGIRLLEESQAAYRASPLEADANRRAALDRRAVPYRAWLLTNRTFLEREAGARDRGWRLFQLAFILAHVPTLASRMPEYRTYQDLQMDEEAASLLYFPTGGGKSEAFYGTLLFGMFLDRARGKDRGVTAMIRYPLRLLTLQQGQRLLKLIVRAEVVRAAERIGNWPFEIGFWVGGSNTPNRYDPPPQMVPLSDDESHRNDERLLSNEGSAEEREQAIRYQDYCLAYNKVPECPVCRSETGLRRFEADGATARRLGIVCFSDTCAWNQRMGWRTPLPFILTDDTIYARAPSIVLGTVDKMAMLGQHTSTIRRVLGMFGLARFVGPTGHFHSPRIDGDMMETMTEQQYGLVFPAFRGGQHVFNDPFPSLIIQDEAHLLEESLGTFSGLFDSLLETTFRQIEDMAGDDLRVARIWNGDAWGRARMPKIIAATATISNPERQLEVLYQREPLRFPCPGSDLYRSFFAMPAPAPAGNPTRRDLEAALPLHLGPERTAPWMRLFVSIMTNGASHTVTAVAVLSAFHTIITSLWRGLLDPNQRAATIAVIRANQGSDQAARWRQEAVTRATAEGRDEEIMALIDLHRISLAYVTNKKGGDQVMDALDAAVRQRHRRVHEDLSAFVSRLISGGIDMKEIQEIMREAEAGNEGQAYGPITDKMRSIVATSAISHGVDVDRFNSMFFAGLPSDIAEYIQASSRVGRTHVGFVMLIPTPQSRRDRYVVETHDIFHRFLERMIAPPAVERWAENAIRRVLASLIQTWAILRESRQFIEARDADKTTVRSYEVVAPIGALARSDLPAFITEIGDFILRAIGFEGRGASQRGRPVYTDLYRRLVDHEITRFAQSMRTIETPMRLSAYWTDAPTFRPPMTSLRDVDEAGVISAAAFDANARQGPRWINQDNLISVMRAIRSQRGSAAETDPEGIVGRTT